jgi:hypothetical protein
MSPRPKIWILTRLAWQAVGNCTADHPWAAIQGMLHVQRNLLDRSYLTQWAPALGVADLLDEAWTAAGL